MAFTFAADTARTSEVTHRTAMFVRVPLDQGSKFKYIRVGYDKVELGYRTSSQDRTFLQLLPDSSPKSADKTNSIRADYTDQYDEVRIVDPGEVLLVTPHRIAFTT